MGNKTIPRRFAKTDARHWRDRLFTRTSDEYQVQIGFASRQDRWPLPTSNKDAAAAKARDIYLSLMSNGCEATRARFKPWLVEAKPDESAKLTIGQYIVCARAIFSGQATTFAHYEKSLRFIASQHMGMDGRKSRFDPKKGSSQWQKSINELPLEEIKPERVAAWRVQYVKAAGNPLQQQSARVSVESQIRNACGLFSKRLLRLIETPAPMPPLPFDGLENLKLRRHRYKSTVNTAALARAAYAELQEIQPEEFKVVTTPYAS